MQLKFGKYRGQSIDEVPKDYLEVVGTLLFKEGQALLSASRKRDLDAEPTNYGFDTTTRILRLRAE
jgi:hypothetical protein